MKNFKLLDMWISIAGIVVFAVLTLVSDPEYLFTGYFVVGGWQVISMLVHESARWYTLWPGRRRVYHLVTLVSLLTMPLGSFWILLFTAPFMAVYYTWICYDELYVKMRRPLSYIK